MDRVDELTSNMSLVDALPAQAQALVVDAFSGALSGTFLVAVPIVLAALVVGLFMKEIPLGSRETPVLQGPASPDNPDSPDSPDSADRVPDRV